MATASLPHLHDDRSVIGAPAASVTPACVAPSGSDLDLLGRWASRVGTRTTDLPVAHSRAPLAHGYIEITAHNTIPDLEHPPQPRWVRTDDLASACELARSMEHRPADFRSPQDLPVKERFLLNRYGPQVGRPLSDIGIATFEDAVRAGFLCVSESERRAGRGESYWVHADGLSAAVTSARDLHAAGGVRDRLRLEAGRIGAERKAQVLEALLRHLPANVTPAMREMIQGSLSFFTPEQLALDAPLTSVWKPEIVVAARLTEVAHDPTVIKHWTHAYGNLPQRPTDVVIGSRTLHALHMLSSQTVSPVQAPTMRAAMHAIGSLLDQAGRTMPATPFAPIGAQLLGDVRYAALWPVLLRCAPAIPTGGLRDQTIAVATILGNQHQVLTEIDALVNQEQPTMPLPTTTQIAEATNMLAPDPSISDIATAISWAMERSA